METACVAAETRIGNDNGNGLCGRPPSGLVTTLINGYFAVFTAQTTDREFGDYFIIHQMGILYQVLVIMFEVYFDRGLLSPTAKEI